MIGEQTRRGIIRLERGKHYSVGDKVYIVNGEIVGNPFVHKMESSEAAFWMVKNKTRVEKSIQRRFEEYGVIGGVVVDCYNMMLYELSTRKDLKFNKDYFGKDTGYTVEEYVLSWVKHMVKRYKNDINKIQSVPVLTTEEMTYYTGVSDEVLAGDSCVEDVVGEDYMYWDDMFNTLVHIFKVFLENRLYRELDYEKILTQLYFNVEDTKEIDKERHYADVAERIGEPLEVITTIVEDMKDAVKENDNLGVEILQTLKRLLEGKCYGWQPRMLRK